MHRFTCSCGQRLYFDNSRCMRCDRPLGYDPVRGVLLALEPQPGDVWRSLPADGAGSPYRKCVNYRDFQVCNWLVPADRPDDFCLACGLNQVIPSLHDPRNRQLWARLEAAKRRLVYALAALRLPPRNKRQDPENGLAFAFLEDQRSNPGSMEEFVATGHVDDLITINLAEADNVAREAAREELNEAYRTLLGHFRHESGHCYWERLIGDTHWLGRFRELFGDETADYGASLQRYYASSRRAAGRTAISAPTHGRIRLRTGRRAGPTTCTWSTCWKQPRASGWRAAASPRTASISGLRNGST